MPGERQYPSWPGTLDAIDPKSERYTLSRLHSKGGLGQVWLARDMTLEREVAFKEIRPERAENPAVWSRFVREAKITGGLEHPSIVPIYELSRRSDTGRPFYTMRFIRGRTMREATVAYHQKREAGTAGPLDLQICDVTGRLVRTLVRGELPAGEHRFVWDGRDDAGRDMPSGNYYYQVRQGEQSASRGMVLIR